MFPPTALLRYCVWLFLWMSQRPPKLCKIAKAQGTLFKVIGANHTSAFSFSIRQDIQIGGSRDRWWLHPLGKARLHLRSPSPFSKKKRPMALRSSEQKGKNKKKTQRRIKSWMIIERYWKNNINIHNYIQYPILSDKFWPSPTFSLWNTFSEDVSEAVFFIMFLGLIFRSCSTPAPQAPWVHSLAPRNSGNGHIAGHAAGHLLVVVHLGYWWNWWNWWKWRHKGRPQHGRCPKIS